MINVIDNKIEIIKDDEVLLEMYFIADEFIWVINACEFVIDKNDEVYYHIEKIMNNNYIFQDGIPSMKSNDILIWLSDQYCDIDDDEEINRVNRLIIKRENDSFRICVVNPYLEKNYIYKKNYIISFSPLFNGFYSRNIDSGLSLQDDFCVMYQNLLRRNMHVLK